MVPASLWWARGARPRDEHLLLLLALLFLARCVFDPWNNVYYGLPFLLSLLAWEVCCRPERPPVLALAATAATWVTFEWAPLVVSPDLQSLVYLAWALPLGVVLVRSTSVSPAAAACGQGAILASCRRSVASTAS